MPRDFAGWDFETAAKLMDLSSRDETSGGGWVIRSVDDTDSGRRPVRGREKTREKTGRKKSMKRGRS